MEYSVYFCEDGILRAGWGNNSTIPMDFLKKKTTASELYFWRYWLKKEVLFEKNLTMGTFLKCLEPFKDFFADYLNIDLHAYFNEYKKLSSAGKSKKNYKVHDYILLSHTINLSPEMETNYPKEMSFSERMKHIGEYDKSLTGLWQVKKEYALTGYNKDELEHYSISSISWSDLREIPLYLNNKAYVLFEEYQLEKQKLDSLINKNIPHIGVKQIGDINSKVRYYKYVENEYVFLFGEVVENFFGDFSYSPSKRDKMINFIDEAIREVEHLSSSQQSQDPTPENTFNILEHEQKIETPTKVIVHDRAFEPLLNYFEEQEEYWQKQLKAAKKEGCINKIGKIESAAAPEERIISFIIKSN